MTRLMVGLALGIGLAACSKDPPRSLPPVPVSVAIAAQRDVPIILVATGTVEPIRTVQVQAQVSGIVTQVAFREGDEVREGQVLFQIDPRPYGAALDKARAALARDQAQAAQAQRDLERIQELATKEYVTAQQADQARAQVAQLQATLKADSAAVEQARLDLEFASVRASVGGRTGSVLVKEGNLVRAQGTDPLVVINQLAPIRVRFSLPSADLARIRARADKNLPVQASPVADSTHQVQGTFDFLDNAVDTLTGTIGLKALFQNKERILWPGELVRVHLILDTQKNALVVPQSAVLTGQQGTSVFTVGPDGKVALKKVTVQSTSDSIAVLADGITAGTTVVTDGQLRLTEGAKVAVRNAAGGEKKP